jgi:predicted DNA-binding protein (MmcQ/YjbR family)
VPGSNESRPAKFGGPYLFTGFIVSLHPLITSYPAGKKPEKQASFSAMVLSLLPMNLEKLRSLCLQLPAVTEGVKWGQDLCFMVGEKMFCVTGLEQEAFSASFKVSDEAYGELTSRPGIVPAPYLARYKWVLVEDAASLSPAEWEQYVLHAYQLVRQKLPAKVKKALNLP